MYLKLCILFMYYAKKQKGSGIFFHQVSGYMLVLYVPKLSPLAIDILSAV